MTVLVEAPFSLGRLASGTNVENIRRQYRLVVDWVENMLACGEWRNATSLHASQSVTHSRTVAIFHLPNNDCGISHSHSIGDKKFATAITRL